jgi:hypothetical protein
MVVYVKANTDGTVSVSSRDAGTSHVLVTDPVLDTKSWWHRDLILHATVEFSNGERAVHYHPGWGKALGSAALYLADVAVNAGMLFYGGTAKGTLAKVSLVAGVGRTGLRGANDIKEIANHLSDADSFEDEGYYHEGILLIRGAMHWQR